MRFFSFLTGCLNDLGVHDILTGCWCACAICMPTNILLVLAGIFEMLFHIHTSIPLRGGKGNLEKKNCAVNFNLDPFKRMKYSFFFFNTTEMKSKDCKWIQNIHVFVQNLLRINLMKIGLLIFYQKNGRTSTKKTCCVSRENKEYFRSKYIVWSLKINACI